MQLFEKKKKAKRSTGEAGRAKTHEARVKTNEGPRANTVVERKRRLKLANAAPIRAKKKQKQETALVGSAIGAYMMTISHSSATACRAAVSNPYLLAIGAVVAAVGVGLFIYFSFK